MLRRNEFSETLEMLARPARPQCEWCGFISTFSLTLKGVSDPEEKRKKIGAEFISVFAEEERKLSSIGV